MRRTSISILFAVLCLFGALTRPTAAGAEPFKCSMCHKELAKGTVVHKPVAAGTCLKCHQQLSDNHPLGEGSMGFIVPDKKKLCVVCHGQLVVKKVLHKPVGLGECTSCHLPHASENKSLLRDPVPALCFRCHPKDHLFGSHGHPPVDKGECLSCHDAHQADSKSLLLKPGAELCYMCHDSALGKGKSIHKPVATGRCVDCHAVHGSPYRKILKADFPDKLYRPFSDDAFPLCFSCHKPTLVSETQTTTATNFRNGDRNLHSVHVKKAAKGRSCKMCHNPHAAGQDRLIYPKAPGFGTWDIPIRYQATPTGGGCSVGCHRTFRYDRNKAVDNSEP